MFNELVADLGCKLQNREHKLALAESCTGGALAACITALSGSSNWFERGFVTYSNESKQECLGVTADVLADFGAVSEQCVREMALGALQNSNANYALAITGIAGPSGGSAEKPVGQVWFAIADNINSAAVIIAQQADFKGDRNMIQHSAVEFALRLLLLHLD